MTVTKVSVVVLVLLLVLTLTAGPIEAQLSPARHKAQLEVERMSQEELFVSTPNLKGGQYSS